MARQSSTPVPYEASMRPDNQVIMTSGRAGVVVPLGYIPILPGESLSGRIGVDIKLAEMPKPLLNGVVANVQAWALSRSAFPQFPGRDELNHAMSGEVIKSLGSADRAPPAYYTEISGAALTTAAASAFFRTLGLHIPNGSKINSDLIDAFNLIYNFRLAAHSSRLTRRKYASEDIAEATSLPPAFWPSGRFAHVVPDYEQALIQGSLDLDVLAGRLPIDGIGINTTVGASDANTNNRFVGQSGPGSKVFGSSVNASVAAGVRIRTAAVGGDATKPAPDVWADMVGSVVGITLNDIDKARITQAYAKLHAAYAGNDATGFDNETTLVALLMQGIDPGAENFKRPWLDSKRVPVGFAERFATDADNLDAFRRSVGRKQPQSSVPPA